MATPNFIAQRYQVEKTLGEGAMGVVLAGRDRQTDQLVAIKSLKNSTEAHRIERFRREGEALARLNHPNIVKMLDMLEHDGSHYIVMELVSGGDLRQILTHGVLPIDRVLTIALELADALTRAHYLNIIHRDIKPENVLLADDGTPRLSDFGVALFGDGGNDGHTAGTYAYLSPEALMGQPIDERTDIWAFGIMLFEMLVGKRPFLGDTLSNILISILNDSLPDIQAERPDVSNDLAALIGKMLVKEPDQRIPSVRLVGAELEAMRKGVTVSSRYAPAMPAPALPETTETFTLPPPFQVPAKPMHFVGREAVVWETEQRLTKAESALVALVGMGGAGKSAIATQVGHQLRERFADGVLWANASISEPFDVLESWGQAFGYDFTGLSDLESRASAVRNMLATRQTLIVLDDATHLSRIRPLLPNSSTCAVLITTRDLDIATAVNAKTITLSELEPQDSYQLLQEIIGEGRTLAEAEAAQEICRLLDHLPLAVEIVAQRLKSHPRRRLRDMARRLRDTQARMDLGLQDQAVRTSFALSWHSLDMQQKRLFSLLGVFAGRPFTPDALANIADLDLYTTEDTLYALNALSLVKEDAYPHYRQHSLLADFAQEKLEEPEEAHRLMTNYFYTYAQEHAADYDKLRPEWDNIMAAIKTAHRQAQWGRVLAFADVLTPAWKARGRYSQAREAYALAHNAAKLLGDKKVLASTLRTWGEACIEQNEYDQAKELLLTSLENYKTLNEPTDIASTQYHLARIFTEQNDHENASALLAQSQAIWSQLGNRQGMAQTLFRQARVHYIRDQFAEAKALLEKTLTIQEEIDDQQGMMPTLRLLAQTSLHFQTAAQTKAYCQKAYELSQALDDKGEMAATMYTLTAIYRRLGEIDTALSYAKQGMPIFQKMGLQRFEAFMHFEMSVLYEIHGSFEEAIESANKSMAMLDTLQDMLTFNRILMHAGDIYLNMGQKENARTVWNKVAEYAETHAHTTLLADVRDKLALL